MKPNNDAFGIANKLLLEPADLSANNLQACVGRLSSKSVDMADMYLQTCYSESWVLENGLIKQGSYDVLRGVGVRAIEGEKTGFAYADEIMPYTLSHVTDTACSMIRLGQMGQVPIDTHTNRHGLYDVENPLTSLPDAKKIEFLQQIEQFARAQDHRVTYVNASLAAEYDVILVVNQSGQLIPEVRPIVRAHLQVSLEDKQGRRERASTGCGGRYDYADLCTLETAQMMANDAVRQAHVNLEAKPAPAGRLPVILGPGWPAVLLHEAVGHGLEGDFNRKGISIYANRLGEQVASPLCTIVDDATLNKRRGSLGVDDEGIQGQCTPLIEKGILVGYMQDKLNAKLMGMRPTGNGRRESYAHLPMPRMTNTYMKNGASSPEEMIASVNHGIYAVNFSGGQVDITSGQFTFSTSEAYLIENGKVTAPIKGATLIGNGPDVLNKVSMVGNDLALDKGVGTCGKDGQQVPVGVGQPTLKIDKLTVGGTDC